MLRSRPVRRAILAASAALLVPITATSCLGSATGSATASKSASPSDEGKVLIVAVNAHQLNGTSVQRLRELADAIRRLRERASNGHIPDLVFVEEIQRSTAARLARMLGDRLQARYRLVDAGARNLRAKALLNVGSDRLVSTKTWRDPCWPSTSFLALRMHNDATGRDFSAAGVHLPWDTSMACRVKDAARIKDELSPWEGPAFAVGDFNQRAVREHQECDRYERSAPMPWWRTMTSGSQGSSGSSGFVDTVRVYSDRIHQPVGTQWTYGGISPTTLCNGRTGYRRSRIDFIFLRRVAGTDVLKAGADTQGWSGSQGCGGAPNCTYSDHRFVWSLVSL